MNATHIVLTIHNIKHISKTSHLINALPNIGGTVKNCKYLKSVCYSKIRGIYGSDIKSINTVKDNQYVPKCFTWEQIQTLLENNEPIVGTIDFFDSDQIGYSIVAVNCKYLK